MLGMKVEGGFTLVRVRGIITKLHLALTIIISDYVQSLWAWHVWV